jgi:hypothetical protein
MNELLAKLLAADILTEDTKVELEVEFNRMLSETIETAKTTAKAEVTAELNEQWIRERDVLIESLDAKVTAMLTDEISELREDIERFRDLEAEYATKLVEAKDEMSVTVKKDLKTLIEKLDKFFEVRLTAEIEELREDIQTVKKQRLGQRMVEAFMDEFKQFYVEDDSAEAKLTETELRLAETMAALETSEKKSAKLERKIKLEKVLEPLSGRSKEVMEAILKNVDTSLLEEAYKTYVGRILKETTESSTKEKVIVEDTKTTSKPTGVVKKGNDEDRLIAEAHMQELDAHKSSLSESEKNRWRSIAGI